MLKRIILMFFSCLLAIAVCGCASKDDDFSALMAPPAPEGELYHVKSALDKYAAKGYALKYPAFGEYLSPYILEDLDGDGVNEAIALYSTTTNSVTSMHVAFIKNNSGRWDVVNDVIVTASAVERVMFADMDNDSVSEIIIGWNIFGTAERQVAVYSVSGGTLVQRLLESYSGFTLCDLDKNGQTEIFINYLNTAEKTATAKLFSLIPSGAKEVSQCPLDANITQFSLPVVSRDLSGNPAIYIDAQKGAGVLTEVLVFADGALKNVFYDPDTTETMATLRPASIPSRDFNGDGIIDIPIMIALESSEQVTDADKSYITEWSSVKGDELKPQDRTIMNYTDGYYIQLTDEFSEENLTLTRKISSRLRVIYYWDFKEKIVLGELFRIQLVSETEWNNPEYDRGDFFEITRSSGSVYTASIPQNTSDVNITKEKLTQMIKLIK